MATFRGAVAVIVMAAFVAFFVYLVQNVGAIEPTWSRLVCLYGGVEAIVFAAVGWLFGREVHRVQAARAEERATRAEASAAGAQAEAPS